MLRKNLKWKELTKEQKKELLKDTTFSKSKNEFIINLNDELAVKGNVIVKNGETIIEIDDDAIIYNKNEGIIVENEKFKRLISLKDASMKFNKHSSTLKSNIKNGFFKEWEDCVKFGTTWVFDLDSLEKKYGKLDIKYKGEE